MGAIVGTKFRQNLPHVSLDRFFRDFQLIGDYFVSLAQRYLPLDVDFALGQRIVCMMFCQLDGDFGRDSFPTAMDYPNRFNY